uniref:Amidase domain-containing protein n=1 Tax=Branchiostoma floridae TaxID=7739 RepID=C3Z8N8_BRAFL|eukprot:XP_002595132.1 hypothetical protein BRAFLDRAFT_67914 [Branchiostoma floridae]
MDRVYNIVMDRMNSSESIVAYTAVSAGVLSCYVGLKVYRRHQPTAQAARRRKIQSLTLTQLTQQLRDRQLSAVQVLQAFQEKGMVTTMGVTKYLGTSSGEDAVIVQVLRKQGAVPFVKTNVPQGLVNNPVFGTTVNPLDPTRSPGGSSGGEAALIRAGGSVLGFGTDGAGSVRGPAHFCGICGFKPTGLRISGRGLSKTYPGLPGVISSPGLLARDVDSLALGLKALLVPDMFQLDPRVVPIPFQQETYDHNQPMRIGYFTTLPCCPPTPSMGRAVIMAKEALEKAGHTKYKEQFQNELKKKDIDVLLCPAFGMPACKPEHAGALAYCSIFNLLDFPAGVVPVTMVTEEDDRLLDDWHGYGNDLMDKIIKETTRGAVGLPVAVQCVALPWQEEKCLRLMKEVETLCPV